MSARKIRVVGDPVLHTPTTLVTSFDAELAALIDDMFDSMYAAEGVGLAATQVGVGLSVFVYDCPDDAGNKHVGHMINPTIIEASGPLDDGDEGCLSVPGPFHKLARPSIVTVAGFDKSGTPQQITGTGFFARCLVHETEHLSGTLYIDHLTRGRRRKVLKQIELYDWSESITPLP
jgi:peptide deformylase